jgi:hypothetical protein
MNIEYEIRRQGTLTPDIIRKLRINKPIDIQYIIYLDDFRPFINRWNPRVEKKTLLKAKPILYCDLTLEIYFESKEETVDLSLFNEMIKNGLLVRKTIYKKT